MRVIDTKRDLSELAGQLSPVYFEVVQDYFQQLMDAYRNEEIEQAFSLRHHVLLMVAESEKELTNHLGPLGPEFVEVHSIGGSSVYQINLLEDNDRMVILFIQGNLITSTVKERLVRFVS